MDLLHDAVVLELRYLRSLECVFGEWVADDIGLCPCLERLDKLVVDTLLYVDPRASTAALAVVVEDTEVDPGDRILDIGVVKHYIRALATQFQCHLLQIRARSGLHDLAANDSAASEGDLVDVHVG